MSGVVAAIVGLLAAVPAVALLPLFMIWLGAGEGASIAAITVAALVPGTRAILAEPPEEPRITAGHAIDALRAALPYAMAVLVAVEMIGGGFGIGALLLGAVDLARSDQILAGCIVLAVIGLALNQLLRSLSKRV
jgi:NitT/TauT family transport system permease protein